MGGIVFAMPHRFINCDLRCQMVSFPISFSMGLAAIQALRHQCYVQCNLGIPCPVSWQLLCLCKGMWSTSANKGYNFTGFGCGRFQLVVLWYLGHNQWDFELWRKHYCNH